MPSLFPVDPLYGNCMSPAWRVTVTLPVMFDVLKAVFNEAASNTIVWPVTAILGPAPGFVGAPTAAPFIVPSGLVFTTVIVAGAPAPSVVIW